MIYSFNPLLVKKVWGGHEVSHFKGMPESADAIGESWEVSAVPGMESIVNDGPEAGLTLPELIRIHGQNLLGKKCVDRYGLEFPLLIKFIDAKEDLSVQVHPDDAMAVELEGPGHFGKTEMWHVVETTAPGAHLLAGFRDGVTREAYEAVEGTEGIMPLLCDHQVKPGEEYFLPAGTVHAIGAGCFVAEVQQSSDITYRIYDYGRPREMHLQKARKAIKFGAPYTNEPFDLFSVETRTAAAPEELECPRDSFSIVMVLDGEGKFGVHPVLRGSTLLISADNGPVDVTPGAHPLTYLYVKL